jgi:hypothetical protein
MSTPKIDITFALGGLRLDGSIRAIFTDGGHVYLDGVSEEARARVTVRGRALEFRGAHLWAHPMGKWRAHAPGDGPWKERQNVHARPDGGGFGSSCTETQRKVIQAAAEEWAIKYARENPRVLAEAELEAARTAFRRQQEQTDEAKAVARAAETALAESYENMRAAAEVLALLPE